MIADQEARRARHPHRRPDVVRRLRDGDRLVPLVLVRAHRRLRAREARRTRRAPGRAARDAFALDEAGGVAVAGRSSAARCGWPSSTRSPPARPTARQGVRRRGPAAAVDDGPLRGGPDQGPLRALAPRSPSVFRAEIDDLVAAGCRHIQLEDLGAWIPNLTGAERDFDWVRDTVNAPLRGRRGRRALLALLPRQRLGIARRGADEGRLRRGCCRSYFDVDVDEFVLDFACREMADVAVLRDLPQDKARRTPASSTCATSRSSSPSRSPSASARVLRRRARRARDAHDRLRDEAAPADGRAREARLADSRAPRSCEPSSRARRRRRTRPRHARRAAPGITGPTGAGMQTQRQAAARAREVARSGTFGARALRGPGGWCLIDDG